MPESLPDFTTTCQVYERRLRSLRRNIIGIASIGREALSDSSQIDNFRARLGIAHTDWEQFQKVWGERDSLQVHADDPDSWPDENWLSEFDKTRAELCEAAAIDMKILRTETQIKSESQNHATNPNDKTSVGLDLPKINIPRFSGDLLSWSNFRDTFVSMVHNENISNIRKFHYLRSALSGEAATLLSRIPVNDESYPQAWAKLKQTYDNPRVLASLYVKRILECDAKSPKTDLQRYEAFLNGVADGIEGFRSLDIPNKTDFLLSALALRALDPQTRYHLELNHKSLDAAPTADEVIEYVRKRVNAIKLSADSTSFSLSSTNRSYSRKLFHQPRFPQRSSPTYNPVALYSSNRFQKPTDSKSSSFDCTNSSPKHSPIRQTKRVVNCPLCKGNHTLGRCQQFSDLPVDRRSEFVNGWRGCRNCLNEGHKVSECTSRWNCRSCNKRHHTLLHVNPPKPSETEGATAVTDNPKQDATFTGFGSSPHQESSPNTTVLLGTVQCFVKDRYNGLHQARAVIDSGSQQTFLTKSLANKLKWPMHDYKGNITGLGGASVMKPSGTTTCKITPYQSQSEIETTAVVVDKISPSLPSNQLPASVFNDLAEFDLADRSFDTPSPIDLLIGADLYCLINTGAPIASPIKGLYLLPTIFGLTVIGSLANHHSPESATLFSLTNVDVEKQLRMFWELEEPISTHRPHPDDQYCETHFANTFSRIESGRYMVRLPFKPLHAPAGDNRELATRRFLSLERRFATNPTLSQEYTKFMSEYINLGHMSIAKKPSTYLIPHHGVWQGTKLRVVFDASCTPPRGNSLNDVLLPGPKLQKDICLVLTRFRMYAIPLCADIVKMYRQILIHPDDRAQQHILWREHRNGPLIEWELNTVTYGIRPSSFQALRVVKQLVEDERSNFPLAADRVDKNMFVDDIVSGADSIEEALALKEQLCQLFAKGGFTLSKWASTEPRLIPDSAESKDPISIKIEDESTSANIKILGLVWNPTSDAFSYTINTPAHSRLTKRIALSSVARIFDPLGFLSPVILLAKILLQDTWKAQLTWDESLPPRLVHAWHDLFDEWTCLSSISVPRYINSIDGDFHLIGFCDASTKGYSAVVYLRSECPRGRVKVSLVKAKTKVAPVKYTSVARLELCAAHLLARLISSVDLEGATPTKCRYFTDSKTVLAWLKLPNYHLKTFEANRVDQILSVTALEGWGHVRSEENPCDVGSRGCTPHVDHDLWWHGPSWLKNPVETWTNSKSPSTITLLSDARPICENPIEPPADHWTTRFSSVLTLIRTIAWMLRWKEMKTPNHQRISRPLSAEDFQNSKITLIKLVQRAHFPNRLFTSNSSLSGELQQLSPFLDEHGIVRVGGRLQNSPLSYSAKHPALIPTGSHLAKLLIRDIHERHYHAGQSLVLALLRGTYWIPRASKLIRQCIHNCVHCRKLKAKPVNPMMAPLPKDRFDQSRTFAQVGVDYAGPFLIKESSRRKASLGKAYLCVFICLATKAIHLEAVSSLSAPAFLAAFERFTSRRGLPRVMWSDNGTNFVGASRFIKDVYAFLAKDDRTLTETLAPLGVEWKFIPPRAPHFGGNWEAGVKSVKRLLCSSIGKQPFTFEELATAFTKIEGLLNSRPLCPLYEDVESFDFLTPGHFLIGAPITSLPDPSHSDLPRSATYRFQVMQTNVAHLWDRWNKEYLNTLQQRKKWNKKTPNIKIGDLVVLLERRSIVGQWPVARVIETHPGSDGVVRTVVVRTPSGSCFTRAVSSLVPLLPEAEKVESDLKLSDKTP